MAGRATFTIVPSRMTMSIPAQSTMSASQRERSAEGPVDVIRSPPGVGDQERP